MKITITEALAAIKIIDKKLQRKKEFVLEYVTRPENEKDPLEKDGGVGSKEEVKRAKDAIRDLQERKILIRNLVHQANISNTIIVGTKTRSILDWLTWKREVAEFQRELLVSINQRISQAGRAPRPNSQGQVVVQALTINIDPMELVKEIEETTTIFETLDGQLSLKNATITIELPE